MKLIIAVVRPFLIDKIIAALEHCEGFSGVTVVDAAGFGQRLRTSRSDFVNPLQPKKQIEIVVDDEHAARLVETISKTAHTGKKGDGIIIVTPIEETVFI